MMRRPARQFFKAAWALVSAGVLTTSLLVEARVTHPPAPPLDPGTAVPEPSATPSAPGEDQVDSTEPSDNEITEDSHDSDNAGELSPSPSPSPSPTPS